MNKYTMEIINKEAKRISELTQENIRLMEVCQDSIEYNNFRIAKALENIEELLARKK